MAWYTAECLFRSQIEGGSADDELWEYRYFLVQAPDDDSAKTRAYEIAKRAEHSYPNASGATVSWLLAEVLNISEIIQEVLGEGTELFHKYCSRRSDTECEQTIT
jgi:hypothetical protein